MKKFFYIILAIMLFHTAVFADEIEELEGQKAEYDSAAEEARQVIDAIQAKIDSVSELKRTLDEEANLAVADYEYNRQLLTKLLCALKKMKKNFSPLKKITLKNTADLKGVFATFILTGKFPIST